MKKISNITVSYACDDRYVPLTVISAISLLKHNIGAHIVLLGCSLSKERIEFVRTAIENAGGIFTHVDVGQKINSLQEMGVSKYVSHAVYARIFIADLLPEMRGKVLYIDCDTLVADSLAELFEIEMGDFPIALAPDVVHNAYKRVISLDKNKPYYNTGVALIDLDNWRSSSCAKRILDELVSPHGKNPLGDQDVIVRVLNDEIVKLPRRWNFLSQYFLLGIKEKPAIYHFSGNTLGRPWYVSSRHPIRKQYVQAAEEAGLLQEAFQDKAMPVEYKIQYFLWRLLPGFLYRALFYMMLRVHIFITYSV